MIAFEKLGMIQKYSVLYIIIFTTFLAYLLYFIALKRLTPTIASSYIYLQPVLTSILALIITSEVLSTNKIIAALMIFTGLYIVNLRK